MRKSLIVVTAALLALFLFVANVAWWMDARVLIADEFVETAVDGLTLPASREATAQIVVGRLADELPALAVFDTVLVGLFSDLFGTEELKGLFVALAEDLQQRIVEDDLQPIVIDLDQYRTTVLRPLQVFSPQLASLVPADSFRSVEVLDAGVIPSIPPIARFAVAVAVVASAISAVLAAAVFAITRRWCMGLAIVGGSFVLAGSFTAFLIPILRSIVVPGFSGEPRAVLVVTVFNGFVRTLSARSWLLALVGMTMIGIALIVRANQTSDTST